MRDRLVEVRNDEPVRVIMIPDEVWNTADAQRRSRRFWLRAIIWFLVMALLGLICGLMQIA